ncbi:MAG: hypothetical protein H6765_06765 [Candidatus Peribacteria bacterium]|nr:MAG: hypothetical protein H6765_06765 [Candidatus Peribacteria bacterium]
MANSILAKDPANKEVLLQIADIEYRKGEIGRAEKPIDYMLAGVDEDAMGLYVK